MKYRREIDGLRALAVIPVILFHAGFNIFSGGFVGVDVFFVISGYLITTIILAEQELGSFSLINFYERRARRILPALFLVMLVSVTLSWLWLLPIDMRDFSQSLVSATLFSSNIFFWIKGDYFDTAADLKPLLHTWSLAIEEQFYILFPIFIASTRKVGKKQTMSALALIMTASLSFAQWGAAHSPTFSFYLLPTRAWELAIGALLAMYAKNDEGSAAQGFTGQLLSFSGLALILYSVFSFSETTPFPSFYALLPTIGAALIIQFANSHTLTGRLLGSKLFVGVGLISYSAYLWHQPLLSFARHRSLDEPSSLVMYGLLIVTFALSYLSWRFVERPFRKRETLNQTSIFISAAVGSAIFIAFGTAGHLTQGFDKRSFAPHLPAGYLSQTWPTSAHLKGVEGSPCVAEKASACHLNSQPGSKKILLVGDSHSQDYAADFYDYVKKNQLDAWEMSVPGCGFIPDHFQRHQGECGKAREKLEELVATNKFTMILFVSNMNRHADQIKTTELKENIASLKALLEHMLQSGSQVIYFAPRPYFNYPPAKAAALNKLKQLKVARDQSHDFLGAQIGDLTGHKNFTLFNQATILINSGCGNAQCFDGHSKDTMPLYRDRSHLTRFGAKVVFDQLTPLLQHMK